MAFPGTLTQVDDFVRSAYPNPVYIAPGDTIWQTQPISTPGTILACTSPGKVGAQNGGAVGDTMASLAQYGPDFRHIWEVVAAPTSGGYLAFYFNLLPGGAGTFPASAATMASLWIGITATNEWSFRRYNPTQVGLNTPVVQALAVGSFVGIERVGTTLTAYYKTAAGSWSPICTATEATFNRAGYIGVEAGDTTVALDTFITGTMDAGGSTAPIPNNILCGPSPAVRRAATI